MALRFHWRLLQGGETTEATRGSVSARRETGLPDVQPQVEFCRLAEECGMDGLLVDIGAAKPDPVVLSAVLGVATEKINFIIAVRSGLLSPTLFVQQVNTLSALIKGRVSLNVVAGHTPAELRYYGDFLDHDGRYERTAEFLAICRALWNRGDGVDFEGRHYRIANARLNTPFVGENTHPEILIGGGSEAARKLSIEQGTCWMRLPREPETLADEIIPVLDAGREVGLRLSVIVRPTREEAVDAARSLLSGLDSGGHEQEREHEFVDGSDSVSFAAMYELADTEWLSPYLWTGAVRSHGAPAIALVGTPAEVAGALFEYGRIGVTQFILSGWPKVEAMVRFGRTVLPLVRQLEERATSHG